MKNLSILFATAMLFTACAVQPTPEDNNPPETYCGDDVCDVNEDSESCAADCNGTDPVCGDGVCEGGEHLYSCPADCLPDDPPPGSDTWIWVGGVSSTRDDYVRGSADELYWNGVTPPNRVWAVGECHALGIYGWHDSSGHQMEVTKEKFTDNGTETWWYPIYREDTTPTADHSVSEKCILSLLKCEPGSRSNDAIANDPSCWMQYGSNDVPYDIAGPYRICDAQGTCGVAMEWVPGHVPQPRGD
ncbi:MAG TPA: hypothetical protein VGA56_25605 [Opitutaceae bacterium]